MFPTKQFWEYNWKSTLKNGYDSGDNFLSHDRSVKESSEPSHQVNNFYNYFVAQNSIKYDFETA